MYQQIHNNGEKPSTTFNVKTSSIYDLFCKVVCLLQDLNPERAK
jgi:hypothetical protein